MLSEIVYDSLPINCEELKFQNTHSSNFLIIGILHFLFHHNLSKNVILFLRRIKLNYYVEYKVTTLEHQKQFDSKKYTSSWAIMKVNKVIFKKKMLYSRF